MRRFCQFVFAISLVALSWLGMMAVHELGHVLGAAVTGGTVERVVLHPLALSRTDVSPNPHPAIVVWLGPVLGCVLPLSGFMVVPREAIILRNIVRFFAGFCLIGNGAYIAIGSFDRIGDCREMLQTGTPQWVMLLFGTVTIPCGFGLWHSLGSLKQFVDNPSVVTPRMASVVFGVLLVALVVEHALSARQ